MQTKAQRAYWANRRKAERAAGNQLPKPRREVVLLATTMDEYLKLCREYPHMRVRLDNRGTEQAALFPGGDYHDV